MKVSKHSVLVFCTLSIACFLLLRTANAQNAEIGIRTVVIDAGHGGHDAGAVGRIYKEKDINLDVALQLGKLIGENCPDVKVVYTRKTDVFIGLAERGDIANKAKGDLFISIHVNSVGSSTPSGVSAYVLGVDQTGKNLSEAMKENDVIALEDDYSAKYEGYKPGSAESFIIFSLMQYAHQSQSYLLADMVQRQFTSQTKMKDRGVRQAGFLVLWKTAMPSILAEFGFISNPAEEKFIGSKQGRQTYARCLFNAFSEYKVRCEGRGTRIVLDESQPADDGQDAAQPAESEEAAASADDVPAASAAERIVFRVQIASSDRKLPKNSASFGEYRGQVREHVAGGRYKYSVGEASSYREALSLQTRVRRKFGDAFLVAFLGDEPIPMSEARRRRP